MDNPERKRKTVPMFSAADFFSGKEDAKPVGWMSDPDQPGPVIVERKTLESLPGGLPLKNRTNIVFSRNPDFQVKGAVVVHNLPELMQELKQYPDDQIYVIGGGQVYEMLLPYCSLAHVTKIDFSFEADTYFPNLDEDDEWEITASSDEQTYFDLEFTFLRYERVKG